MIGLMVEREREKKRDRQSGKVIFFYIYGLGDQTTFKRKWDIRCTYISVNALRIQHCVYQKQDTNIIKRL